MAPRWLQDGSRWPQVDQDSLLGAFLGLQTLSWKALDPQKPVKNNGLTLALPLLCLRFALVSPLLYLPFSFPFRMGGAPLSYKTLSTLHEPTTKETKVDSIKR